MKRTPQRSTRTRKSVKRVKQVKPEITEFHIPSRPEYVSIARLAISGIANRMSFDYDAIEDIKLSVSEACTNIVKHAYKKEHPSSNIIIQCAVYPHKLDIIVKDTGQGFQPDRIKPYKKGSSTIQADGSLRLGLFLIKNLMDKVEISSQKGKGTQVRMIKNLVR